MEQTYVFSEKKRRQRKTNVINSFCRCSSRHFCSH